MSSLIRPKFELDQAFMPALVTSNSDDDSIKNEHASMERPFSHLYELGATYVRASSTCNPFV